MTHATAWQYIFSNVEKEQSPNNRRGFQTLFASRPELSPDDEAVLSTWANSFSQSGLSEKFQYFPLSGGRRVVSRIVPLPEQDRFGRGGRFLAHSLIFSESDWHMLNADPFPVISSGAFFSTVAEALEHGDFRDGNITSVEIDWTPEENYQLFRELDQRSRTGLLRLAWACIRHKNHLVKKPIAVSGPVKPVLFLLRNVFSLLPRSVRMECFFDTSSDDCDIAQLPVILAGYAKQPPDGLAVVHPDLQDAINLPDASPETAFEHWWVSLALAGHFESIVSGKQVAEAMQSTLEGQANLLDRLLIEQASNEILTEFNHLNSDATRLAAYNRLAVDFSPGLATRLLPNIVQYPQTLWHVLLNGLAPSDAARLAEANLWNQLPPDLLQEDVHVLQKLALDSGSEQLALLVAYYERDAAPHRWLDTVKKLSDETYEKLLDHFLTRRSADLLALLTQERAEAWLPRGLPRLPVHQLLGLGQRLIDFRNSSGLERLVHRLNEIPQKDQVALKKRLQQFPGLAPDLWDALKSVNLNKDNLFDRLFRKF